MTGSRVDGGRNYSIKATGRAFDIIEAIKDRNGAGVTELADHFDVSKSTVHNHLSTLEVKGYVVNEDGTYRLGLRFLTLGGHVRDKNQAYRKLYETAKPEMDAIAEETGENCQLIVAEEGRGIIIYKVLGRNAVRTDGHIGTEVYLHCTSLGKAVLAHLPRDRVEEIIDQHGLPHKTDQTITSREVLYDELTEIREHGFAFDNEERLEGMCCVAAPIRDDDGEVLGSLSVSGPKRRMKGERFTAEIPELVRETTRIIELNATYS